jgi:hypothetical protein
MPAMDRFVAWCQQEQTNYRRQLEKYQSGRWRVGEIEDGTLVDKTGEAIEHLKARLTELDALLSAEQ